MALQTDSSFWVRHLEGVALDGAYRVHLPADALDQLHLRLGDVCQLSEDGKVLGYGIAWRAKDTMKSVPKQRPARMSEVLRSALDIKDGTQITISRTTVSLQHATKIVLRDVTPSDYSREPDDRKWMCRCFYLLCHAEAVGRGAVFDVLPKKGAKRRFRIEEICGEGQEDGLFTCNDETTITFTSDTRPINGNVASAETNRPQLNFDGICGLQDQIQIIQSNIDCALGTAPDTPNSSGELSENEAILIHGYKGTGKSSILRRLREAGFRRVCEIGESSFFGINPSQGRELISKCFNEARAAQPSLILMDDIQTTVPKNRNEYALTISDELSKLRGTRVVVVAACRSLSDINEILLKPDNFTLHIELPIPDTQARAQLLSSFLKEAPNSNDSHSKALAMRTHGFTGEDLKLLWVYARRSARWRGPVSQISQAQQPPENRQHRLLNGEDTPLIQVLESDWDYALQNVRPTALRELFFERPNIKWSDIGGSEDIKKQFDEIISWPLFHGERLERHGVKPTKGVLLYGPPGCSKTLTAQAVATTYELNFIAIQGAELISMYVGESERAVREIFQKARAAAPCVIFFDEIDSIASERESSNVKGLNVLTTLLNEMDGFARLSGIIVLAATNKPEALDPAIMRAGRFGKHIYLGPPNETARREIFSISTKPCLIEDNVSFETLVTMTKGYSGAEIVSICSLAGQHSLRRELRSELPIGLQMADFTAAIEQTPRGISEDMLSRYQAFAQGEAP